MAIGHRPNTDVFRDWLDVDEKGYLLPHLHTQSRIPGVFISGDVVDHRYRQAVTAAGDGARAAIDAERWLEAEGIAEAHDDDRLVGPAAVLRPAAVLASRDGSSPRAGRVSTRHSGVVSSRSSQAKPFRLIGTIREARSRGNALAGGVARRDRSA